MVLPIMPAILLSFFRKSINIILIISYNSKIISIIKKIHANFTDCRILLTIWLIQFQLRVLAFFPFAANKIII